MCQQRILVADDETDIRNILRRLLLSQGYCVCEAGNGIEALAAAEHCDVSLILMDVTMPRMTGTEAIRQLRANPRFATTPIMIMTGNPNNASIGGYGQVGGITIFAKPLDLTQVLVAVQQVMRPAGNQLGSC
jgi:two-component system chemotaxis response regulator CheY